MFTLCRPTARLIVLVPLAALLAVGCEHDLGPTPGPLATITVTPNPANLAISALQPFVATGRDADSNLVSITPTWSVVAGGGTIDASSGLFTAGSTTGTFTNTVRATSGAISGFATVIVTAPGTLVTILVSPDPGGVIINGTIQFTAEGRDAVGTVVPIPPPLVWSVVNATAGSINSATGLFTAGTTPGNYSNAIKATSGSVSGFATVIVTATAPVGPSLGSAATYGILAGSAVTCASPPGLIDADVGVSPGTSITGFGAGLCTITGATEPGTAPAAQAQLDLTTAYDALVALPCNTVVVPADLGGLTLAPGVYCTPSSTLLVSTAVTLDGQGDPNAVWVFQVGSGLTTAGDILLTGGAQAQNVWWQVTSSATLGTGSTFRGNIVALTSITLTNNVTMIGRALARNGAVDLNGTDNSITLP